MELHQLRCAIAVAEHGSFTRAAAAMHITQPGLSYTISKLESDLGVTLFTRVSRRVALTPAGEALLAPARRALAAVEDIRASTTAVKGALAGRLHIACMSPAMPWLGEHLARFKSTHPGVACSLYSVTNGSGVAHLIQEGQVEFGAVAHGAQRTGLTGVEVARERLVAVFPVEKTPSSHTITIQEFGEYDQVAPFAGTPIRDFYESYFREVGILPNIVAEYQDLEWGLELVRASVGCTMAYQSRVRRMRQDEYGTLEFSPALEVPISLVYPTFEMSTTAATFLKQVMG